MLTRVALGLYTSSFPCPPALPLTPLFKKQYVSWLLLSELPFIGVAPLWIPAAAPPAAMTCDLPSSRSSVRFQSKGYVRTFSYWLLMHPSFPTMKNRHYRLVNVSQLAGIVWCVVVARNDIRGIREVCSSKPTGRTSLVQ